MAFRVAGIPSVLAAQVRRSMRSPQYGHPAHREIAAGYGPCSSSPRPAPSTRTSGTRRPAASWRGWIARSGANAVRPPALFLRCKILQFAPGFSIAARDRFGVTTS